MKQKLKPGDLVYRVVDVDHPDDGPDQPYTWAIESATVVSASDRQIVLSGAHRLRISGTRFKPHTLGLLFFAEPESAVVRFLASQRRDIESAERAIETAVRAIAWVHALYPDLQPEQSHGG